VTRALVVALAGLVLASMSSSPAVAGRGKKPAPAPAPAPVKADPPAPVPTPPPPPPDTSSSSVAPPTDSGLVVGILDVRVVGMSPGVGDEFEHQLEALSADAAKGRFWIGTRSRLKEMLEGSTQWIDGCLLGPCMKVLREQTRVAVVLTVFLQSLGTTYRYVITLIRTDTGAVIDQRTDACGACTQDEAVAAATIATVDAVSNVPEKVAETALADPAAVTLRVEAPLRHKLKHQRSRVRTAGLVLTGLAAIGGGLGGYWLSKDKDNMAGPALGAAAGLATAGLISFAVAWTFD